MASITRRSVLCALAAAIFGGRSALGLHEGSPTQANAPTTRRGFLIDPGHGGDDFGAVVAGRKEKDIALCIAKKVRNKLESLGASARLTRSEDFYITLDRRIEGSSKTNDTAFISLHLNQVRSKGLAGIKVYAYGPESIAGGTKRRKDLPPLPAPPLETIKESRRLAEAVVSSLRAQGHRVETASRASLYVLKNPSVPSILIEMGYLSNPQEAARLGDPAYQDRLAGAIAVSLKSFQLAARNAQASLAGPGR